MRLSQKFHFQELNPMDKMVAYEEGPLATVAVVENLIGHRTIYVDNVGVAGTDRILLTDQKSLAHVPMLFLKDPKSALTVGFGSGGASYSYTLYPELEKIDCIVICKTVPQVADTLKDSNHGVLDEPRDPRYRILFDDARSYLRFTKTRYDIIATDCTDLRYKSNANLYDVEYFKLCKDALTDKGMVVVWMPLGGMSPGVFATALKTFAEVFPDMTIWYMNNEPTHYLLLLGTRETNPLKIDLDTMMERISRPQIQKDLAEVSLQQPEKILSCFLEAAPALKADFVNAPLNTEDFPHLEFESPKYGYSDEPLLDNLELLRKRRTPVRPYLEGVEKHPDFMARLAKFEQAIDPILAGHAYLRRLETKDACMEYLKAAAICPEDLSVQHALTFDDILRRAERFPNDVWAWVTLGETDFLKKDYSSAANRYAHVLRIANPADKADLTFARKAAFGLAMCYKETGEKTRALEILDANKAIMENDPAYKALREELGGVNVDAASPSRWSWVNSRKMRRRRRVYNWSFALYAQYRNGCVGSACSERIRHVSRVL